MASGSTSRGGGVAAALLGAAFAGMAVAVATGRTRDADNVLRRRQPHPRRGLPRQIAEGVKVVAKPPVQLPLAAAVTYGLRRARVRGAEAVLAAAAATFLLDKACKRLVQRDRPPGYEGDEGDQSFPSGHTASTAALTLTVATLLTATGRPAIGARAAAAAVTLLVAESRLLLDEHWPSDVLAGALLGGATAYGTVAIVQARRDGAMIRAPLAPLPPRASMVTRVR